MYKPVKSAGDTVEVPQLLFSKLTAAGVDDALFRVGLYVLQQGGGAAQQVAGALRLPREKVERCLSYWEGAGLIELEAGAPGQEEEALPVRRPRRLTTREVVRAGEADPTLGMLLDEVQRLFKAVVGESDCNLFASLYMVEGYPVDLILMAASETAQRGVTKARYVEQVLKTWRGAGINDCAAADHHLKMAAEREAKQKEVARQMGLEWDPFTLAEKRKIAIWFEEYGYDSEMIEMARLVAGDKRNDVKYLAGILKKWYAKGYIGAKDVQAGSEGSNLRVVGPALQAPQQGDALADVTEFVPLKPRKKPSAF